MIRLTAVLLIACILSGCAATRSSSKVTQNENAVVNKNTETIIASEIILTEEDILDRKYLILGDIKVSVSKTTIFNKDPTNEMVAVKLKEEAAELGADAVILVRYGTVGMSMMSWMKETLVS